MYVFQLAWRYVRSRWVNYAAVIAVALAVTVQIVVMAVLDGQLNSMKERVRGLGEQITITFDSNMPEEEEYNRIRDAICQVPGVVGVTPMIRNYGLLNRRGLSEPVVVYGIDLKEETRYSQLPKHLTSIKLNSDNPDWRSPLDKEPKDLGLLLGHRLASRLDIRAGDEVRLAYTNPEGKLESTMLPVTSRFQSGDTFFKDAYVVYIPLAKAQECYLGSTSAGPVRKIQSLSVWLTDPEQAKDQEPLALEAAMSVASPAVQQSMESANWEDRWQMLVHGMAHENMLQELLMVLMNLSSGFCVFAILATLVSRRVRDVGLLRCIGVSRRRVAAVFLLVGLCIGTAGSALGVAGGYGLTTRIDVKQENGITRHTPVIDAAFEIVTGQPLYPPRMFGLMTAEGLPVVVKPFKVLFYALGATILSVLAAAYPAVVASRQEPVEALRDE